jgi:prevent-host-death family protein
MTGTIGAGEFKAKCLQLIDEVAQRHEEVIITKRGRPLAKLVPVEQNTDLFGAMAGSVSEEGDLLSPIVEPWEADG